MTSAAYQRAAKVAGFIDRAENLGKKAARAARGDHRKPPEGVVVKSREERIALLLKRDGNRCRCGCGETIAGRPVEIEHRFPLKDADGLPAERRAWYFSPENERLFLRGHQARKTAGEATARAHHRRAAEKHGEHVGRLNSDEKNARIRKKFGDLRNRVQRFGGPA